MASKRRKRLLDGKQQQSLFTGRLVLPVIRFGLVCVAWLMTWKGVTDFVNVRELPAELDVITIGNLTVSREIVTSAMTGFVVAMLIFAMYVALKRMLAPIAIWKRVFAAFLYVLLFLFSVGFGYGFWWGLLAGKNVNKAEARAASDKLHFETTEISARLAGVQLDIKSVAGRSR